MLQQDLDLFRQYRKNLNSYLLSTDRICRHRSVDFLKAIYSLIGQEPPKIIFCESPQAGYQLSDSFKTKTRLHKEFYLRADYILLTQKEIIYEDLVWELLMWSAIEDEEFKVDWLIGLDLELLEEGTFNHNLDYYSEFTGLGYTHLPPPIITPSSLANAICRTLVYRRLGASIDAFTALFINWLFRLMQNVGWLFPYQDISIVCDRPTKLALASESYVYAEEEVVLQFNDGYKVIDYWGFTKKRL
jgi:hypothetical protein